jgi:hypothetical protein
VQCCAWSPRLRVATDVVQAAPRHRPWYTGAVADHQHTVTGRSVDSYEPSRVQADDDGTWIVQFTADEQFGEGLALLRAAAWLAHHREHTLRELSFSWAADEDSGDLDASVQLVVIANMNNPHYPAAPLRVASGPTRQRCDVRGPRRIRAVRGLSETSAVDSAGRTRHCLVERGAVRVQVFAH